MYDLFAVPLQAFELLVMSRKITQAMRGCTLFDHVRSCLSKSTGITSGPCNGLAAEREPACHVQQCGIPGSPEALQASQEQLNG